MAILDMGNHKILPNVVKIIYRQLLHGGPILQSRLLELQAPASLSP